MNKNYLRRYQLTYLLFFEPITTVSKYIFNNLLKIIFRIKNEYHHYRFIQVIVLYNKWSFINQNSSNLRFLFKLYLK